MFRIRTRNTISPLGLQLFDSERYLVSGTVENPDALLLRSYPLSEHEIGGTVKAAARAGAGVNNIPVNFCTRRGIVVFNTPGANANSVKELVIAALLLSARGIHEGMNWVANQAPDAALRERVEKEKSRFAGTEIAGKKLGVAGLGAIGVLAANAACELGMDVYGCDPFISIDAAWGLSRRVRRLDSLEQMMQTCDYLTIHIPITPETEGLIGAPLLEKAKRGLRLLNFSRGALVNPSAVKEALAAGSLRHYITDFPSAELLRVPGVISIPHLGASTAEAEDNCAAAAVRQLRDYLERGNIVNSVNFPACSLEPAGGVRLILANRNIPNMLSQVLGVLAREGLNVEDMVNRHKENLAYNIIDLSAAAVSDKTMSELSAVDGVVMTRQIRPAD